mgnify:CR=1 FL=1
MLVSLGAAVGQGNGRGRARVSPKGKGERPSSSRGDRADARELLAREIAGSLEAGAQRLSWWTAGAYGAERSPRVSRRQAQGVRAARGRAARRGRARERREGLAQLAAIPGGDGRLVLATGRYAAEGFDGARLATPFLAMPIALKLRPRQRFVLLVDIRQADPGVYRGVQQHHREQAAGIFIHQEERCVIRNSLDYPDRIP